jgi:hypothetical protein
MYDTLHFEHCVGPEKLFSAGVEAVATFAKTHGRIYEYKFLFIYP